MTIVPSLKNINFMSQNRFNSSDNLSEEELYAVNIGSVLTTNSINKTANGYVKLGNGIIIQWGYSNVDGGQITLPTPFTNTNYRICATYMKSGGSINNDYGHICTYPSSTTSFYANTEAGVYQWIAIGY